MELRQVRYFEAVARLGSFTRAAEELRLAQPALSQQIRRLERELGVELLDRAGRRMRPTAAGEAFLVWAERVVSNVESAKAEMREHAGLGRGRVVVGSIPAQSLGAVDVPSLLADFNSLYPGIEVSLNEGYTEELVKLLKEGRVDLAFGQETSERKMGDAPPGIAREHLFTEDYVLLVGKDHGLAGQATAKLKDLAGEPFITFKPGSGSRDLALRAAAAEGFVPRIAFESGEVATVRALASRGLGVAVLPRSVADAPGASGDVVELVGPELTRTVSLMWSADRYRPAAARAFLEFARGALNRRPADDHP